MKKQTLDTFDVFDTLVTRAVGEPTSVFILMGRLGRTRELTGCGPEEFARLRVAAEKRARQGREEVTLEEIYTELTAGLPLAETAPAELVALELSLEERLSRPVPEGRDRLATSSASTRMALSDVYLPQPFVEHLLRRHGLDGYLHGVRVSSAQRATKSRGALYRVVADEVAPAPRSWCHHGDNRVSDIRVPRALGIRTRPVTSARLTRYEALWEEHRWETQGFTSLLSGASRAARLATDAPPALRPLVDVTCGVAAPILTAYVLWVLHQARRRGLQRLYFLARDGEILWLIAQRLAPRVGVDVDLRYLYGSRSVYHRARLAARPLAEADWAWSALYRLSGRDVLLRLGFSPEGADKALARLGLEAADGPLDEDGIRTIASDEQVAEEARSMSSALSDRVQSYLRQEGLCDDVPYGVVDTGWAGRILRSLDDALPDDAPPMRHAFLFGSIKRPDGFGRRGVVQGYLFDEHARTGFHTNFHDAYGPLETFTVANHGSTVDFAERGGRIEPVLASSHNPALDDWPWDTYRAMLMRFVDELVLEPDLAHVEADVRPAVAAVLGAFWSRPTAAEAAAWGRFVYEDDILAQSRNHLAVPIQVADFVQKARPRYEGKRLWLAGSVAVSPRVVRPAARVGLWFNEARRQSRDAGPGVCLPARWRDRVVIGRNTLKVRVARSLGNTGRGRRAGA